ncbi:24731_t:CDS:1, partial [Dentiscutata erythropus]
LENRVKGLKDNLCQKDEKIQELGDIEMRNNDFAIIEAERIDIRKSLNIKKLLLTQ